MKRTSQKDRQKTEKSQVNKIGRPRHFKTPEELYNAFLDYVQWTKDNPIIKTHFVGKDGNEAHEAIPRPITFLGFEGYLAEHDLLSALHNYVKHEAFIGTITRIKAYCKRHNIDHAATGIFKENIISRLEGLKEQSETTNETKLTEVKIEVVRKDE